ncbi:hypothetical protein AB0F96_29940 [Streptomyces sp. NPDC023998]|uniref:hypothetical protein n=1 Tax=Streptomyces sp. NPDC023998 TaxID=3154597 RepID=UPI0033E13E2B
MVIRRPSLRAIAAAVLLLLTACSRSPADHEPKPSPHPVFSKPLGTQPYAALQQTQNAGSASFTQKVTFTSKQGDAVQTTVGSLNFAGKRGAGKRDWTLPKTLPGRVKDALLGTATEEGLRDSSAVIAVDPQTVHYRSASAKYWLRYGANGDHVEGLDSIAKLRGTEAALSGTLLETVTTAKATAQRNTPGGGRSYRTEFGLDAAWGLLFPADLSEELAPVWKVDPTRAPVVMTLTVDSKGRITRAEADLSALLRKDKESALATVTSIHAELALAAHGAAKPAMPTSSDMVLDAGKAVMADEDTKPGDCIDFNTGARTNALVVRVTCSGPHDARVFAQTPLGDGGYPGRAAAERRALDGCGEAFDRAPSRWTDEAVPRGHYWSSWPLEAEWKAGAEPVATCYVASRA